ncbi:MAG: triacylglycerol lipase [Deltaproteobacteria bacterium]|nr:triacylglycerol lipase [Deltaproteobacteria bacterium]
MRNDLAVLPFLLCALAAGCSGGGTGGEDADDGTLDQADGPPDEAVGGEADDEGFDDADGAPGEADDGTGATDDGATCTSTTDPLGLRRERPELDLVGAGPLTRLGSIEGPCLADGYRVVAPGGMRVRFEATTEAAYRLTPRLAWYGPEAFGSGPAAPRVDAVGAPGYTARLEVEVPAAGEYLLLVHDLELRGTGPYALSATCLSGCGREATRFPLVLVHGFGGWDSILGGLEYYYGVADELAGRGYDVYTTVTDAVNDTPTRARQLAEQLDAILEATGARKLNLVAHSQGGLDGRYLIGTLGWGDRVGALVMISTPNRGTPVADALVGDLPVGATLLAALFDAWGAILGGSEADTRAAFEQITTERIAGEFNPAHPDDPRVAYWSFAGLSCGLLDFSCQAGNEGETVDPLLAVSYELLQEDGPNDGLVPVASAEWGVFFGSIPADHWDEIGQLADSGPGGPFDHLAFYAGLAARLHAAGL